VTGSVFKPPFEDGFDHDSGDDGDRVHEYLLNAKRPAVNG
jgi:hypothetical protein